MAPNQGLSSSPSSYPGIFKYPTDREKIRTGNSLDWLETKRKDDNVGGLWRVHDKLYNLEPFISKHPGGSEWIEMTQGTDITEAYMSAHAVNIKHVDTTLEKYYVKDASHPRMSPFTFKPDGFYMTLKRKVEPILKRVGTGPTMVARLYNDAIILTSISLAVLGIRMESRLLLVLSGFMLTFGVNAAHNFFHLRQNWRTYYWDLSLLSSYEWRIMHSLSHHLYTNTIMDAEISALEPVLNFLPSNDKNTMQKYGSIIYIHISFLMAFVGLGKRFWKILQGTQKLRPENLLNVAQLLLFMAIAPNLLYGIQAWLIMHTASSYLFFTIATSAAHHHPEIFHDGDEARSDPDFGLCQLDAVRDRKGKPHTNFFVQMVIFGEHSLHHLFPTVCHSKLHHLKGMYEETLREFSEQFPAMTQWELYLGCLKQLGRIEPKKLKST